MIFGLFKISGHSMLPRLKPKDIILVSSLPYIFKSPKIGDIVLFRNNKTIMVKRIVEIKDNKLKIEGDNKKDSFSIGWIKKDDIIGKVYRKI